MSVNKFWVRVIFHLSLSVGKSVDNASYLEKEVKQLLQSVEKAVSGSKKGGSSTSTDHSTKPLRKQMKRVLTPLLDTLMDELDTLHAAFGKSDTRYMKPLVGSLSAMQDVLDNKQPTCKVYRKAVSPYRRWFDEEHSNMGSMGITARLMNKWTGLSEALGDVCY